MQLYWHTTAPHYAKLQTVPENRVYVSPDRADAFIGDFTAFANAKVVSDEQRAPGIEIGRPNDVYRRVATIRFSERSLFWLPTVISRFRTGAKQPGTTSTIFPMRSRKQGLRVQFPGGYIAEIHSAKDK